MITQQDKLFSKEWIKAIFQLKESLEYWALKNLQDIWHGKFQSSYMRFLLTIDENGSKAIDLARENGITKQAMSKIIKQLEVLHLIEISQNQNDKRSAIIRLSAEGKKIIDDSLIQFTELILSYKESTNDKKIYQTKESLSLALQFIKDNTH